MGIGAVRGGVFIAKSYIYAKVLVGIGRQGFLLIFFKRPSGARFHSKSLYFLTKSKRGIGGYWGVLDGG